MTPKMLLYRTSSILQLTPHSRRLFSIRSPVQACRSTTAQTPSCSKSSSSPTTTGNTSPSCSTTTEQPQSPNPLTFNFWTTKPAWKRASINTLRCLVGCTLGDFSALWILQTYYPHLGMGLIMGASMASGITTSIILETILLRRGADQLSWPAAARTAMGMSMVSMLAMETAENLVDYHLTGGMVNLADPMFWAAAATSITAGYLAPLPYNYLRLRKYGRACH
ncbi:hypothetical protein BO83DRAFT_436955 [Aspergillus eucalypticola CBS 122712]|uniref:DUF4396 domain-containing protein n=1 Tax=Aspergillus eucalypticola (strain CBS 122712 / IBT 29274) TaxID=1448314 RepID=A0A317VM48_ASPEC|nr:uncharacterized protein BO83DRAFT_436955 [Aspergillus eucalypticola CBS 122712]PWY74945.1 hypothetical protein BO83DRAFT_436955 [Aspergillus eucalypticola CBS 122712]